MRLIDADALLNELANQSFPQSGEYGRARYRLIADLRNAPTVDAVPVRHGKWTADETLYTQGMAACSCCKAEYYRDDLYMVGYAQGEPPKYCPNCGARMDEE